MIAWFIALGFVLGIVMVWLYASIRSRYGPGVQTAICAAATVWFLAYCYPNINFGILGLFPTRLLTISTLWGLAEMVVAGIAGAWAYTEA
jgi:hypothetical protein